MSGEKENKVLSWVYRLAFVGTLFAFSQAVNNSVFPFTSCLSGALRLVRVESLGSSRVFSEYVSSPELLNSLVHMGAF